MSSCLSFSIAMMVLYLCLTVYRWRFGAPRRPSASRAGLLAASIRMNELQQIVRFVRVTTGSCHVDGATLAEQVDERLLQPHRE